MAIKTDEVKKTDNTKDISGKATLRKKTKLDGWVKLFAGFGKKGDKSNPQFHLSCPDNVLDLTELRAAYDTDGFTRREITCISQDMVSKGFTVGGDASNVNLTELDRLNWSGNFYEALNMSRLLGGSAILMGLDDGKTLDQPLAINSIKGCRFLRVYPRDVISPNWDTVDKDPRSEFYGIPETFSITDGITSQPYKVHRSRLLLFPWVTPSATATAITKAASDRIWGTPVLYYTAKQISNLSLFHDSLANLTQEAVIGKYKFSNLAQMLAGGEEDKVLTRLDVINTAKSVINAVILDADGEEDYTRDSISFAGMNGVADTMMVLLSCVSEIPVTRFFGRSPSGLDASGESDLKIYYDMVSSYQKIMLTTNLQRLVFYIDIYKKAISLENGSTLSQTTRNGKVKGEAKGTRPVTEADITITFNALYKMTEKEQADAYKTNSEADKNYLDMGIISKEEIRATRFVGGYNQMISVESGDIPEAEEGSNTNA